MAVSITELGAAQNATGSGGNVTLGAIVTPSSSMIIVATNELGTTLGGSVSDTDGNTYNLIQQGFINNSSVQGFTSIWYALDNNGAVNNAITYTARTSGVAISLEASYVLGAAATSPLDARTVARGIGSGKNFATTSGLPTAAGDFMIGVVGMNVAGPGSNIATLNNGFVTVPGQANPGVSGMNSDGGHLTNSGVGAVTFSGTLTRNARWTAFIQGFFVAGPNAFPGDLSLVVLP
jgi:hypothetical protein